MVPEGRAPWGGGPSGAVVAALQEGAGDLVLASEAEVVVEGSLLGLVPRAGFVRLVVPQVRHDGAEGRLVVAEEEGDDSSCAQPVIETRRFMIRIGLSPV